MATQVQPTSTTPLSQPTQKPKAGRLKRAFRKFYKVITSHLGLIVFLVAFSFLGAAIFHAIEGNNEKDEKADIQWLREQIIDNVWNATPAVKRNEQAFRLLMRLHLKKYETHLYAAYAEGINTSSETEVWDFWGALFYCATVYTTIGYGNISPATDVGRIVTMVYALIGIPLCLIVLADLGKLFTRAIKWVWAFIRRFYYTRRWTRKAAKKVVEEKSIRVKPEDKLIKKQQDRQEPIKPAPSTTTLTEEVPVYVVDDEFNLPVSLAIIITFVYILLGALIYCQWEKWSYLEAFYFVFISVSTIGFGDVLPDHPKYFLLSSVYVLVGLSLVAMVINVIMETLTMHLDTAQKNIAEIARTVGIGIEDEDLVEASQNGTAQPVTTTAATLTPQPSTTSLTATTPHETYATPSSPAPRDDTDRGRDPYARPEYGRQDEYTRGREPYRAPPPDNYRGRPEDYRGPPDYRGEPRVDSRGDPRTDPRSPADPRVDPRIDPRDPRYDPRLDPRDPRYDPRVQPRSPSPRGDQRMEPISPRGDPRYDPRSPADPRMDTRFDQRGVDPRLDQRGVDPRIDQRGVEPRLDQRAGEPRMAEPRTPRSPAYGSSLSPPQGYT